MSERAALEVVLQIGGFPSPTMAFALKAIQMFSYWTSLPFRLPHEDEIRFENSALPEYWNSLKTLVYTRNKEFKYRTYHPNGGLNSLDIETYHLTDEQRLGLDPILHLGAGIPFYILIDKDGVIVDFGEHLRPSIPETRNIIDKYIQN